MCHGCGVSLFKYHEIRVLIYELSMMMVYSPHLFHSQGCICAFRIWFGKQSGIFIQMDVKYALSAIGYLNHSLLILCRLLDQSCR